MMDVKNLNDKLVCRIDEAKCLVEIVLKDCKTLICIAQNGKLEVTNTRSE